MPIKNFLQLRSLFFFCIGYFAHVYNLALAFDPEHCWEEEIWSHCCGLPDRTFGCEDFLINCVKYSEIISPGDAKSLCSQNIQLGPCKRKSSEAPISLPLLKCVIALEFESYFQEILRCFPSISQIRRSIYPTGALQKIIFFLVLRGKSISISYLRCKLGLIHTNWKTGCSSFYKYLINWLFIFP